MSKIAESPLSTSPTDVGLEAAIELYNTTLTAILDNFIPLRTLRIRQRPSDPWFDKECRNSKQLKRKLEQRYLRSQCQKELTSWVLQKSLFKRLCRQKRKQFWDTKLSNSKNKSAITWSYINKISGRGKCNPTSDIDATDFQKHLTDKIESVKKSLSDNMILQFSFCNPGVCLNRFDEVDEDEVVLAIEKLPNKQCSLDPIPTCLLKKISRLISPFLMNVFNNPFSVGFVPDFFKLAHISPLLKKTNLDKNNASSYRPISNLSVLNKLLE